MAEEKKSVIVYAEWIELFESLQDDEAGKLIKHFFRYVNDLDPVFPDRITELSFIPIKQTLKRDLKKWSQTKEEKSINGRKGNLKRYYLDIYKMFEQGKITLEQAEDIAKTRKNSLPDSDATKNVAKLAVNVNDNVNVNANVNVLSKDNNIIPEIENFGSVAIEDFNFSHSKILKFESPSWLESVAMQQKITIEEIQNKIDEFVLFLSTTETQHKSKKAFLEHFINWLTKKNNSERNGKQQSNASSGKKPYRFDLETAIAEQTSNSSP